MSTRKGAPSGLRLPPSGQLSVDTGQRSQTGDPSPSSIYSSSPSASTSSMISRNHSFSLDYYALPSPAPQSPSGNAYPLPQPPRSYSTSSTYSNYSQGVTPVDGDEGMGGPPKPSFLGGHPRRQSSRGSLGNGSPLLSGGQGNNGSSHSSPGLTSSSPAEYTVSLPPAPPHSPTSPAQSRKSSWGESARRSPLGGFLALRKSSAGKSPTGKSFDASSTSGPGGVQETRRKSSAASDNWSLPNRPPPQPPQQEEEQEVIDISWARKMVEEMEADTDGSDSEGSRRGSAAASMVGLGVGLDKGAYSSAESFYGQEGHPTLHDGLNASTQRAYDRPRAEDLSYSPTSSNFNLSSSDSASVDSSSVFDHPPTESTQTTPRQAQHASSARSPLGVPPSPLSSPASSPQTERYSIPDAQPRPDLPHQSSVERTNRRIHVVEATPASSPVSVGHPTSGSLYPTTSRTSSNGGNQWQMSTSPAGSGTSSQAAATGHSPQLDGSSFIHHARNDSAGRRLSDHQRALAFVVPPDASERSVGQLQREVYRNSGEVIRLDEVDPLEDSRAGHRTREAAEWNEHLSEEISSTDGLDDGEDEEYVPGERGGVESSALKAARERAARARSLHLASIEVTQATSPTTLSPQSSPALAAYSFSAEQEKRRKVSEQEEGRAMLGVERPKRSAMRPSRTPSPALSTEAPTEETVGPLQVSPKRMSTPAHQKQSSTSTIRAFSASPRRRSSTLDPPSPQRPFTSQGVNHAEADYLALHPTRTGSTSTQSSGTHARTLEELTAVLDLAINDAELDSNLALAPNYGSPIRTSRMSSRSDDGAVSPPQTSPSRSLVSLQQEGGEYIVPTPEQQPDATSTGLLSFTEDKTKPRRMSKETEHSRGRNTPVNVAPPRTRASDDVHARLSAQQQQQQSLGGSQIRKTTSMASLGQSQAYHQQPARHPLYANSSANVQASRMSLAEPSFSPTANSFAKTGKWPRAMIYTDVKGMRTPGERATAYAQKINDLQRAESGLLDWLRWRASGGESSRSAPRRNSPSMLGTIVEPSSRNVSSSSHTSTMSEEFPLRQGPAHQATQMRNVSPPSGPPPNLPYPQLAPGIGDMRSSPSQASMRTVGPPRTNRTSDASLMSISSRPSISSSIASVASNPGGFLSALGRRELGRRGSMSASQAMKFKTRSPPQNLSSLPSAGGSGGLFSSNQLSPRKGSIRGIEISSPSSFTKGSGQIEGGGRPNTGSPSGPRDIHTSTAYQPPSRFGLERLSLDEPEGSSTSTPTQYTPPIQYTAPTQYTAPPVQYAPPPSAPSQQAAALSPELKEMVEILDADPRILSKYLEQARNDPTAAIGQFLMDQSQGRLLRA